MQQASSSVVNAKPGRRGSSGNGGALALSERDDLVLRAIYDLHFLTAEQVCRLYFRFPSSLTHVREILKALSDAGYLQRLKMPSSQDGVKPFVYTLARAGVRYLKQAGFTEFPRVSPSEHVEHSWLFLEHTMGINDIVIAAKKLSELEPRFVLADFLHERVLKRRPVEVTTPEDGTVRVIPDLWLDLHIDEAARASIALEYDRATVSPAAWQRKIRALIAFADGPYQQAYGSESLTLAIATTGGDHHADLLRGWIEHELEHAGRREESELFLITALPEPSALDPRTFFLSPAWMQPFGTHPVALLQA
jgi:hypothetical protein